MCFLKLHSACYRRTLRDATIFSLWLQFVGGISGGIIIFCMMIKASKEEISIETIQDDGTLIAALIEMIFLKYLKPFMDITSSTDTKDIIIKKGLTPMLTQIVFLTYLPAIKACEVVIVIINTVISGLALYGTYMKFPWCLIPLLTMNLIFFSVTGAVIFSLGQYGFVEVIALNLICIFFFLWLVIYGHYNHLMRYAICSTDSTYKI